MSVLTTAQSVVGIKLQYIDPHSGLGRIYTSAAMEAISDRGARSHGRESTVEQRANALVQLIPTGIATFAGPITYHDWDDADGLPSMGKLLRAVHDPDGVYGVRTRDEAVRLLAPAHLYLRARILARYEERDGKPALVDQRTGSVYDTNDVPRLKAERVPAGQRWSLLPNIAASGVENFDLDGYGEELPVDVTSSGVLFPVEPQMSYYWAAMDETYPGDPYGDSAPSPRAVAARLLDELNAQTDWLLVAALVALLSGIPALVGGTPVLDDSWMMGTQHRAEDGMWEREFGADEPAFR